MIVAKKPTAETTEEKDWENPINPEAPHDERDKQQAQRAYEEAQRRNENLTDVDKDNQ